MTDKRAIYSPNRHEITVYYTPVLSVQESSCKDCLHFTEKKISCNKILKSASLLHKGTPCIMQRFLKVVKMVI